MTLVLILLIGLQVHSYIFNKNLTKINQAIHKVSFSYTFKK